MAINRVEIRNFLVFKGEYVIDFCKGINVLIGSNGTGKTTLLRGIYEEMDNEYFRRDFPGIGISEAVPKVLSTVNSNTGEGLAIVFDKVETTRIVYIPEKDILEHARGLLPFIEQKPTGFGRIYRNLLVNAQDIPMNYQNGKQKAIGESISGIIGGYVQWEASEGIYYTIRTDGMRIPFSNEASGFKKLGLLGLLVTSGQLEAGTTLFWDEPENSLNPENISVLVDILLSLSRSGVQVLLATHSELFASYINTLRESEDKVMFYSLDKDPNNNIIKLDSSERFELLKPNNLKEEPVKLYEIELERSFG